MSTHAVPGSYATSETPTISIHEAGGEGPLLNVRFFGPRAYLPRPEPAAALPADGSPTP